MGRCSVLYESGARDAVDTRWDIAGCICEDGWGVDLHGADKNGNPVGDLFL